MPRRFTNGAPFLLPYASAPTAVYSTMPPQQQQSTEEHHQASFDLDEVMGRAFLVDGENEKAKTFRVNVARKIQNGDTENPNYLVELGEGDGMIEEVLSYSGVANLVQRGRQVRTTKLADCLLIIIA